MAKRTLGKVVSSLVVCVYVCSALMHEWTHVGMCARECGAVRLTLGAFLHLSPPYKLRKGLSLNLEHAVWASLASGLIWRLPASTELRGSKLVLSLSWQTLYTEAISQAIVRILNGESPGQNCVFR